MYTELRRKAKVGYFGSGLAAYWPQFPELRPAVMETMAKHRQRLEAMGCEVVDGGLVDAADKSNGVGDLFARGAGGPDHRGDHDLHGVARADPDRAAQYCPVIQTLRCRWCRRCRTGRSATEEMTLIGAAMTAPEVLRARSTAATCRSTAWWGATSGEGLEERGGVDRGGGGEAGAARQPAGLPGSHHPDAGHVHGFHHAPGVPGHAHRDRGDVRPGGQGEEGEPRPRWRRSWRRCARPSPMPPPGYDRITEKVDEAELAWAVKVACVEEKLVEDFSLDGLAILLPWLERQRIRAHRRQ